jgi:hypothetical protein
MLIYQYYTNIITIMETIFNKIDKYIFPPYNPVINNRWMHYERPEPRFYTRTDKYS